ncbi:unnamed protein product [Closterium sp. Yama58-4]|nr:unnamed protein product [Closterium sp. Yama58-4]
MWSFSHSGTISSLSDGRPLRSGKAHFPKGLDWARFDVFFLLDGQSSRKQVAPGAGNVYYKQLGNAGSINNQGVVNNQAARAVKDGTGLGSANVQQENSQTQTASANPVTTTVQVDAVTSTTDYTGSTAALPAASILAPGVGFSGVGVGSLITTLPGPDPLSSGLVRQGTDPRCHGDEGTAHCDDGASIFSTRVPIVTISTFGESVRI